MERIINTKLNNNLKIYSSKIEEGDYYVSLPSGFINYTYTKDDADAMNLVSSTLLKFIDFENIDFNKSPICIIQNVEFNSIWLKCNPDEDTKIQIRKQFGLKEYEKFKNEK